MANSRVHRKFPETVRLHAIKRIMEGDKITSELSKELGIQVRVLNRWKKDHLDEEAARQKESKEEVKKRKEREEAALLDSIASQAMVGLLSGEGPHHVADVAEKSYLCALYMLKARKRYLSELDRI